jgi:hypothetical protein
MYKVIRPVVIQYYEIAWKILLGLFPFFKSCTISAHSSSRLVGGVERCYVKMYHMYTTYGPNNKETIDAVMVYFMKK